jgi:hypothetical protein
MTPSTLCAKKNEEEIRLKRRIIFGSYLAFYTRQLFCREYYMHL